MNPLASFIFITVLAFSTAVFSQEFTEPIPLNPTEDARTLESLEALERALDAKESQVDQLQQTLVAAQDEVTRQESAQKLRDAKGEFEEQRRQFEEFAVEIDLRPFTKEVETSFDWQQELGKLLKPIMAELENATAESRAVGELRAAISDMSERKDLASEAVDNLEALLAETPSPALTSRLTKRLSHWKRIESDASNRHTALDLQLQNRLAERQSMLDETTGFAKNFIRTRGLNLLLAIGTFCIVFFGVRALMSLLTKMKRGKQEKNFTSRLTALLMHMLSIVGGLVAMMLVFNMVGDWFMLGIIIIFLLGLGWASINTLPAHVETVKLVLNIGMVKENERVEFEGVPYNVEALGLSARLVNPLLDGGERVFPVKALVGYHSRVPGEREEWFPTRTGDWVELSDGKMGRIAYQNPSSVQLVELGGAQTVYSTAAFVALNPKNLSTNFRVLSTFGIDYKHQAIATTEVPGKMQAKLESGLPSSLGKGKLLNVDVFFHAAAASSLDYEICVDVDGAAAPSLPIIKNAIQQILVDACNENGWEIPFTQITVHQSA